MHNKAFAINVVDGQQQDNLILWIKPNKIISADECCRPWFSLKTNLTVIFKNSHADNILLLAATGSNKSRKITSETTVATIVMYRSK